MRVFSLARDHLLLLDNGLQGRLSDALAEVAREGGDPSVSVERARPVGGRPSSWFLLVLGGSQPCRFEIKDLRALGVTAHIYLVDLIEELKADLRLRVVGDQAHEQLEFQFCDPWPRRHPGEAS